MEAQLRTALKKEENKLDRLYKNIDETQKLIEFYKQQIKQLNMDLPGTK